MTSARAGLLLACLVVLLLPAGVAPARAVKGCRPGGSPDTSLPSWARQRHVTLLVDSVLLGGSPGVKRALPCWRVGVVGRPALMVRVARRELAVPGRRVAPLVVVGLGYNSLWEHDRRHYARWAAIFDREAEGLLRTLRRHGARQIIWQTVRQPTRATVPPSAVGELRLYSWYFPYVNERLRRLDRLHDDVSLADWRSAADRPGVTYDSIHPNTRGQALMGSVIKRAIRAEAERQRLSRSGGTR